MTDCLVDIGHRNAATVWRRAPPKQPDPDSGQLRWIRARGPGPRRLLTSSPSCERPRGPHGSVGPLGCRVRRVQKCHVSWRNEPESGLNATENGPISQDTAAARPRHLLHLHPAATPARHPPRRIPQPRRHPAPGQMPPLAHRLPVIPRRPLPARPAPGTPPRRLHRHRQRTVGGHFHLLDVHLRDTPTAAGVT